MSGPDDGPAGRQAEAPNPPARMIRRLNDHVERVIRVVQIFLFAAMIGLVSYEVVMRYVFNAPTVWSESAARLCMVWLVVLGMNLAIRHGDHIRVDFFVDNASPRWQAILAAVRIIVVAIVTLILIYAGYKIAVANWTQIASGIRIPVFWKYIVVPIGSVIALLFLLERVFERDKRAF